MKIRLMTINENSLLNLLIVECLDEFSTDN